MSTTPATTSTALSGYVTFLKAHERLIIILASLLLAYHFYGDVLNVWTNHDKRVISAQQTVSLSANQVVKTDQQQNELLNKQLSDLKQQYQILSNQIKTSTLVKQQQTDKQKETDDNSTLAQIGTRTAQILRINSQEIASNADDSALAFSKIAATANVNLLEDSINDKSNNLDLTKQLAACDTVLTKQDQTLVLSQTQLTDEKLSHQSDVKLEQDKTKLAVDNGKKQFRRGFKFGAIVGFVGGLVTFHYL